MRDYFGHLSFRPKLPVEFKRISFPVVLRSRELVITMDRDSKSVTYLMRKGRDLAITHFEEQIDLVEGEPQSRELTVCEG
jgi:trehalose/maltose hydrolase-like predicted phosphorylase